MVEKILCMFQDHGRDVPLLRGRIHYVTLLYYPLLFKSLADRGLAVEVKTAIMIFYFCYLFNMVSTSLVHNNQLYKYRSAYKRIDYASIFLIGSASSLPLSVYYMKNDRVMAAWISIMWILTFVGVFSSIVFDFCSLTREVRSATHFFVTIPNLYTVYKVICSGPRIALVFIFLTYLLIILSTIVYCSQWPNLLRGIFEHHELFHTFNILALGSIVMTNHLVISSGFV